MNRTPKANAELELLKEERDQINIEISLISDSRQQDPARRQRLQRTAEDLDNRIARHRLSEA